MIVVYFVYGLGFFLLGVAILLKQDKRTTLRLRNLLLILAAFGLLHGASEWSDMFLALGQTYWTPGQFLIIKVAGFYVGLSSFVFLLAFGVRSIALERPSIQWLERASLVASFLFVVVVSVYAIRTGLSSQWFVTSGVLERYFLGFPGSMLVAAGLFRQSQSREIREIGSPAVIRNIRSAAAVFIAYAFLAGIVVPAAPFPPASFINYASFENAFGFPVQVFRAVCSVLAAWFIMGILNAFSAVAYRELETQVQERTADLAKANQALLTDIEVRKGVEAELEKSRDVAVKSSNIKSEFLANMSHEIRTPLNGVMGMTDLALETELTRDQREYLETVKLSADSLLIVINDILDFSKIEAGRLDLEVNDFNLRDCLETTLKTLSVRADEKSLELLCEVDAQVPEVVRGDFNRLRQVVVNLVGNAIKFTETGEVVLRVQVEAEDGEDRVLRFVVADTGIGIPAEKQQTIFEAFSQADGSTTRKYGGTGLGLTISKRLVEKMGGKLWVKSEVGRGSEFHFTVRLRNSEKTIDVESTPSPEILRNAKILVVDDNRTNRRILEGMLGHWEVKAGSVENGNEALAQLSAAHESGDPYALVLIDMHMPEMDGFALVERIRQRPELSTATIMMLSSAGNRGDAARCERLKVSAYLLKPIRQSQLREAVVRVLAGREQKVPIPLITRYRLNDPQDPEDFLRVLVAEDNQVNSLLAKRLLEKRGHHVVVAANGREALEALDKENFDLVLMDMHMPELDGLQATAAIREREKGGEFHQEVIALTANAMGGDRERCLAGGMDGYLSKPIRIQELDELLEIQLARRKGAAKVGVPNQ